MYLYDVNNDTSGMASKPDVGWSTCTLTLSDMNVVSAQRLEPIDLK